MIDKILKALKGRTTAFLLSFFVIGNILQFVHRLDGNYIAFLTAIMTFVTGHSLKEDLYKKGEDKNSNEGN